MKKFLKIFAIISSILILLVIVCGAYGMYKYKTDAGNIQSETATTAIGSIKAISAAWDPAELQKREHPRLIAELVKQNQNLEDFFKIYRKLGALKGEPACTLANFRSNVGIPTFTLADYTCTAPFENATATFYMELLKDSDTNGAYLFSTFRVDSPLFLKILEK